MYNNLSDIIFKKVQELQKPILRKQLMYDPKTEFYNSTLYKIKVSQGDFYPLDAGLYFNDEYIGTNNDILKWHLYGK
jgi:hypothetical protein